MQQGTVEDRHEVLGLHLDNEIEVADGTVVVAQLHTHQSSVIVRQEIVGVELKRIVVVAHRPTQIVEVDARQSTVDVAVHVVGLEVQRLGERLVGSLPFPARQCHIGTGGPCVTVVRIQLQAFVEPLLSVEGILLLQIHLCLQGIGVGIVLPFLHDGVQFRQGGVILFVLHPAEGAVEPIVAVARLQLDGGIIVCDGIPVSVLADATDGTEIIDVVDVGIEVQRLAGIALRTDVIVKVELCHTSVVPRLIQIGLGTNGEIEVLDREDEVFIIQRTAPGSDQTVHTILRRSRCQRQRQKQ